MRCLDLGSMPDDGSSSRMICGFPIMLSAKHSWKRWQTVLLMYSELMSAAVWKCVLHWSKEVVLHCPVTVT